VRSASASAASSRWTRRGPARAAVQWEATLCGTTGPRRHAADVQPARAALATEGISVYEEKQARAEWGREMDVTFAGMLNRGETLKLKDVNSAFTNPQPI
jgi:hypothetical protein